MTRRHVQPSQRLRALSSPFSRFALSLGVLVGGMALSTKAHARPPRADSGAYILLAPGLVYIPLGDDDFEDMADPGYSWGFGVGGLIAPGGGPFTIGIGMGLDHQIINWDDDVDDFADSANCNPRGHIFRMSPELRLGGQAGRFFGYGILAPGLAIANYDTDCRIAGIAISDDDTHFGFNFKTGGGFQIMVTRHFGLGAEMFGNLGFMQPDDDDDDSNYDIQTLDLRALLTWRF